MAHIDDNKSISDRLAAFGITHQSGPNGRRYLKAGDGSSLGLMDAKEACALLTVLQFLHAPADHAATWVERTPWNVLIRTTAGAHVEFRVWAAGRVRAGQLATFIAARRYGNGFQGVALEPAAPSPPVEGDMVDNARRQGAALFRVLARRADGSLGRYCHQQHLDPTTARRMADDMAEFLNCQGDNGARVEALTLPRACAKPAS